MSFSKEREREDERGEGDRIMCSRGEEMASDLRLGERDNEMRYARASK